MIWILYIRFQSKPNKQASTERFLEQFTGLKKQQNLDEKIRFDQISSKKELWDCVTEIQKQRAPVTEWHIGGNGGSYGPLFGSSGWPELMSAHEWRTLEIPFAQEAQGWFYMEHAALWLAPFLAARYEITCYGWEHWRNSIRKSGPPQSFPAGVWEKTADYDPIAPLYAETFSDITVRQDEWNWIYKKISNYSPHSMLDIGCGNGALLGRLAPIINKGVGVDVSKEAINIAEHSNSHNHNVSFITIDGPLLPFADKSFDLVISLLSFRYLDWDPILQEMTRVLTPGGRLLIIDMTASSLKIWEWPLLTKNKLKNGWFLNRHPKYHKALIRLVTHPDWEKMLRRHPMLSQHDFTCYVKSRFPHGKLKVLNTGRRAKIIAFDSGPVDKVGMQKYEST